MEHPVTRVRHEPKKRRLVVREAKRLTPTMQRIVLEGRDLDDFVSKAPDDHIKVFVPTESGEVERRDYTPRRFDPSARTLAIDFALHDGGPVTTWATQAKLGDALEIGGPRGSMLVPWTFDWWLLIGDETALPAIGRRIEEAPAGTKMISVAAVSGPDDEQRFETRAEHTALWARRPMERATDPEPLLAALANVSFPTGDGFIWVAAEAKVARAVREYINVTRGHPRAWTKASGYWTKGLANAESKLEE
jgi:NADPH-dependent ferric siderophore reductase